MTTALEGSERSAARPDRTLLPGKTRYPLHRRLGGPQGRSGRAENLVPTGIRSRTIQPIVSCYTDWVTQPTQCLFYFPQNTIYFIILPFSVQNYTIHQINPMAFQGNSSNLQTWSEFILQKNQLPLFYLIQKSCYTRFKRPDNKFRYTTVMYTYILSSTLPTEQISATALTDNENVHCVTYTCSCKTNYHYLRGFESLLFH